MKKILLLTSLLAAAPILAAADTTPPPGVDLTIENLYTILRGLACWSIRFIFVIIVMAVIWYGLQFIMSKGNEQKFAAAKKNLWYGIIGIVVILSAYTIIATIGNAVNAVGGQSWSMIPLGC